MLAQNFKKPADLGITDRAMTALMSVLALLERQEVSYRYVDYVGSDHLLGSPVQFFNMKAYRNREECGTVLCIKGAAEMISNISMNHDEMVAFWGHINYSRAIHELFLPDDAGSITVDQAAIALRNFLTHGEPRWAEARAA